MTLKDLKPAQVFAIFDEITKVPRPSKKEGKIRQYLLDFAAKHGIEVKTDAIGNVAMYKPATAGKEQAPTVVLQAHMDMVCESNDKNFDFENTPISTVIDGEWVRAEGTTLGADNGIGMAAAMAALSDDTLVHGPLEALFTVDEETGLTGANNLGEGMISGKILLNLDSEDDAEIFVGCAGGVDTTCTFSYKRSFAPTDFHYFRFDISGGCGGHSGGDIHLGRANANKLLARFLYSLSMKHEIALVEIDGGNLRNAIPRAAHAVFGIDGARKEDVRIAFNLFVAEIENEYSGLEPNLKLDLQSVDRPEYSIDYNTSINIIRSLYSAPHGVISMSRDLEGLVETSTNLASVKMGPDDTIIVGTSQRSSIESCKNMIANQVASVFKLADATVTHGDGYPGWAPNPDSKILKVAQETYKRLFNKEAKIMAIHAGLECGLFLEKYPNLDMISFGPTLRDVHSPNERIQIDTVGLWWSHLLELLKSIPAK